MTLERPLNLERVDGKEKGGLSGHPSVCSFRTGRLALPDAVHSGPADRAVAFRGRLAVLHRHLGWVLHVTLGAALEAVRLHWTFPFLLARRLAAESSVCSARRTSVRTRLKTPRRLVSDSLGSMIIHFEGLSSRI